jgi:protein-tyrosine phosphatase
MIVPPCWITPQLAIIPRPVGEDSLADEMQALREANIDVVVSLLENHEAVELGLKKERRVAEHAGMVFVNFPIVDHGVPKSTELFLKFLSHLEHHLANGKRIGVHCRACIGRSSVVTASLLVRSGIPLYEAWTTIAIARQYPVPDTADQAAWVSQNIRPIAQDSSSPNSKARQHPIPDTAEQAARVSQNIRPIIHDSSPPISKARQHPVPDTAEQAARVRQNDRPIAHDSSSPISNARQHRVPDTDEQAARVSRNDRPIARDSSSSPRTWTAEILKAPPLIAPARQFTYPQQIAGEEDALARGALQLLVHPASGGDFLATCALGFTDSTMPTGVHPCPNPDELCAVAGGYAYIIDTLHPEHSTLIALMPVVEARPLAEQNLLLFTGFHTLIAWGPNGEAWHTQRLSWEGIRITSIEGDTLYGTGWNLRTDKEVPFAVDLRTGQHQGGGFS